MIRHRHPGTIDSRSRAEVFEIRQTGLATVVEEKMRVETPTIVTLEITLNQRRKQIESMLRVRSSRRASLTRPHPPLK
jgi:hypothetical protein